LDAENPLDHLQGGILTWTIDPAHTIVGFSARHMALSTVRGNFTRFDGSIELDPNDPASARGRIEIDLASVDTGNEQRDGHLVSPDFFDVEHHPTMVFELESVSPTGNDTYEVVGDLTIKGITRAVRLSYEHAGEGTDPFGNHKLGGSLTGVIKRSDWDLVWNVPLEGGGWLVSDKIKIEVDGQLVGTRADAEAEAGAEERISA
jgi:polyisoprenoid-binding protein YceI